MAVTLDVAGVLCWCLMSLAFVITRSRVRRFNVVCGMLLGATLAVWFWRAPSSRGADGIVVMTGLMLYYGGLLILRTILSRSVSLHLLICYSARPNAPMIDDRIAGRLDDALKYHLVYTDADRYALSRFGAVVAFVLAGLYRVVGID